MKYLCITLLLCTASITRTSSEDLFDAIDRFDNTSVTKLAQFANERSEKYEQYPINYALNLYYADSKNSKKKRLVVVVALLDANASPNTLDDNDESPLDRALKKRHESPAILEILQATAAKEHRKICREQSEHQPLSEKLTEIEQRKKIVGLPSEGDL